MATSTVSANPSNEPTTLTQNPLSEREMDVAQLLATGASNAEIARGLTITANTVKVHLRNIYEKLEVNSRTEASMRLVERGWLSVPGVDAAGTTLPATVPAPLAPARSVPAPPPLAELPVRPTPWQRALLLAILATLLALLVVPALPRARTLALSPTDLLSERARPVTSAPRVDSEGRWVEITPLPNARTRAAATLSGETIYVIGGEDADGKLLDGVATYDLAGDGSWQRLAGGALPLPLSNAAAATLDEALFVAGGTFVEEAETGVEAGVEADADALGFSDTLWRLTPETAGDGWATFATLPTGGLAGAALVADDKALYLIGGWDGQAMHNEVWRLAGDNSARWELVTQLDAGRAFLGAALVDGVLYVVGGHDGARPLATAAAYHLADNQWQTLPSLSTPRAGLALAYDADGSTIWALGGGWSQSIATQEKLSISRNDNQAWIGIQSPIEGPWYGLSAVAYEGRLHLIGGWSGDYLDQHLQYQSSGRFYLPVISND